MSNWKEGDYGYGMRFIFLDADGDPIDIRGGTVTVKCELRGKLRKYTATIEDGINGVAVFVLPDGLLYTDGTLKAQATAITSNGKFTSDIIEEPIDEVLGSTGV